MNNSIYISMEERSFQFTDENVSELFGKEAAEDEELDRLKAYYIKGKTHERVTSNLPLRILVGHKGIGKSAIFTIARHEDQEVHRVSLLIRPDDISSIGKESNDFDQMIRDWKHGLVSIITDKICETIHYKLPVNENNKVDGSLFTQFLPFVKSFCVRKLEEAGIDNVDKLIVDNFIRTNRVIVYIDDLDRGWEGKDTDIRRISALLNAVRDLSNDNKGLQFRISLRTDVYYLVRTSDESTDKIGDAVIWHSWSNHEILLLLIKRIESFFNRPFNVDTYRNVQQRSLAHFLNPVFEQTFTDRGKWEHKPMYIILMSLIRKRPRDLVKLCNAAAKCAYDNNKTKIDTECLKSIFVNYSQDRIQDTVNEYRSELKDIERLLLNMKPSAQEKKKRDRKSLLNDRKGSSGYIYSTSELKLKLNDIIQRGNFIFRNGKKADANSLLHFLYKINFITARKEREDGFIDRKYFEENKYLTSNTADFGYDWEVHPAFRWALNPLTVDEIYMTLQLSADDK